MSKAHGDADWLPMVLSVHLTTAVPRSAATFNMCYQCSWHSGPCCACVQANCLAAYDVGLQLYTNYVMQAPSNTLTIGAGSPTLRAEQTGASRLCTCNSGTLNRLTAFWECGEGCCEAFRTKQVVWQRIAATVELPERP